MLREEMRIVYADDSRLALNTLKNLLISYGFKNNNLFPAKDGLELLTILEKTEFKKENLISFYVIGTCLSLMVYKY